MSRLLYRNNELVVICATTEKLLVLVGSLYSVHVLAPKHYSLYRTDKKNSSYLMCRQPLQVICKLMYQSVETCLSMLPVYSCCFHCCQSHHLQRQIKNWLIVWLLCVRERSKLAFVYMKFVHLFASVKKAFQSQREQMEWYLSVTDCL